VTTDESWLYDYDPETKEKSMKWWQSSSLRLKFPSTKILWKFLASIFWYQEGILLIDYLPKVQTINAENHTFLLVQLRDIFKEKRRGEVTKGILFLHDNAPAPRTLATQNKLYYLDFHFFHHPPYTPELGLSEYHLFPGLKKQLKFRHFSSDAEVIAAEENWLDGQRSEFFFFEWLEKLAERAKNCIDLRGELAE